MRQTNRQLLARVSRPLLKKFNGAVGRACLRRDAYLDRVFRHEAEALKNEIPERNSDEVRAYLQDKLQLWERVPVNFSLSAATIEAVNSACEELNVIRDCFVNRILFLLTANVETCEVITGIPIREHLAEILGQHDRDFIYAPLWGGGLDAISEIVNSDPFWALRNIIEDLRTQGDELVEDLHACVILPEMFSNKPSGVIALNCYLPSDYAAPSDSLKQLMWDEIVGEPSRKEPDHNRLEMEQK
jgi:hypothetical protein